MLCMTLLYLYDPNIYFVDFDPLIFASFCLYLLVIIEVIPQIVFDSSEMHVLVQRLLL